ncbi:MULTISPECIES: pyruvate dehydrogenase (acetyl-transferring), homodimeric type [Thermus]|uniref:Pyruvate dehydrogenase E1 component n=3 Tax=Thermus thermophilus TaxID=274 RepID=Q5SLV8_THET8|nr:MULTISPECIES: pyruvate dehydrogenase (acetyl-transferring), homodimeric type [Thermus]QZY58709.1 pyruvate dehydrogenase (acetyl-transferring), homodimeric type [Thermus thermophilus]BAD70008.1 pyruvate dehydrogenase complex, pyruvate dehydrogenase E1 component [Thermus thermophilus HB8]BDA36821.1 pyruvate dehydrogenase E1 component [Thermus thermophilus]BDE44543.1 pyruvate dehydrogenase E1 component [Thermus thermophilus]HAH40839.1 pyruvate dehydrogenase (acetyl-transferring), homodimeric t
MTEKELKAAFQALSPEEKARFLEIENREWLESLEYVLKVEGPERVEELLRLLDEYLFRHGVYPANRLSTPYLNTLPKEKEPPYPGDLELERRIANILRWNVAMMVTRANKKADGIGGHIATYASIAELYEVGFNHFFRGPEAGLDRDLVFFQGHASPGNYARAFLEGRLKEEDLENFRREVHPPVPGGRGLSSYPHPWLMPDFWEFPTVSMGLGPIQAIYQARFMRYLEDRGLKPKSSAKVWAFLGDGEHDEPETVGALHLAARENLDNLIFVVNCNLQRLDGPVRGNSKVIQELERLYRGAGWRVIKVVWGSAWDELLAKDKEGHLLRRFEALVDGESQRYAAFGGKELRERFFNTPELKKLIEGMTDEELTELTRSRGGHDMVKIYAAYKAAVEHRGSPVVILARTIKGYGMGPTVMAKNVAHQVKKLTEEDLKEARRFLGIPIPEEKLPELPYYHPGPDSPEVRYLLERRKALGGFVPERRVRFQGGLEVPEEEFFREFYEGSGGREISTTMAFVRILAKLLRHPKIGKYIVPIVPDEARTFGMEALIAQVGVYSPQGQLYVPVDAGTLTAYKESQKGQILEEGITEAGAMAEFIAAGTAYAHWGIPTIPFFITYSMFGLQRIGDLVWAAADQRARGFFLGATAGRTTLAGEGLQHQDGQSHVYALAAPNLLAYDPAFAYEFAVILEDGLRRMYGRGEDVFYYITIENENYVHPPMPEPREKVKEGILKGLYLFRAGEGKGPKVQLFGTGPILNEALKAQELLAKYGVVADVWSATSYKALYVDAIEAERETRLLGKARRPYVQEALEGHEGPIVAATDYLKALPNLIRGYVDRPFAVLGTDGFGRSDTREALRDFFEVDARHIAYTALALLHGEGKVTKRTLNQARKDLGLKLEEVPPHRR